MSDRNEFSASCPLPGNDSDSITLAHGGGGSATQRLLEEVFLPAFGNPALNERHDGAVFGIGPGKMAFTTDSYVVTPHFFPGGDIGALAVNGTVNDLAMCGARPLYLSAGFILEEGFPMADLKRIVLSMTHAARVAGVSVVTGDLKVVDRGCGDGVFINTSGVGHVTPDARFMPANVRAGDVIILSGDIGRHGIAVMTARNELEFENIVESDCAPLAEPILEMLRSGVAVHCARDATRGGIVSALVEVAQTAGLQMTIDETAVPVDDSVRGACELLGLDPFYVANEGRFVLFVPQSSADLALRILHQFPVSSTACRIGTVADGHAGLVAARTVIGGLRALDMFHGEQLPRIC